MGLLSSRMTISRYKVTGQLKSAVHETVYQALKENAMPEVESDGLDPVVGWTSLESPYVPDFEGYSFVFGDYMVFSLRVDKKTIPAKLVKKHLAQQVDKRMKSSGRTYLSKNEKGAIRDQVLLSLSRRIPATPNVYDLAWHYTNASLCFFSTLKSANEALETHFTRTFGQAGLGLISLFPYTTADLMADLSDPERDLLNGLAQTRAEA